jgi:hypothetical protein
VTNIRIRDLIDLVASGVSDPEARLEKIFEWIHSRNLEIAKWFLALAAGLLAAAAVGLLKTEATARISLPILELTLFAATLAAAAGLFTLTRGSRLYRRHLAAQALLGEITKIRAFISSYRSQT